MSRKLIALIVAGALASGIGVRAEPTATPQGQSHVAALISAVPANQPPLRPAGAAGIRESQGTADLDVWFITGLIVAAIVAAILLADDDEATNSTN